MARALFGGVAAHAIGPLTKPLSASVGMALLSAGQTVPYSYDARSGSVSLVLEEAISSLKTTTHRAVVWATDLNASTVGELEGKAARIKGEKGPDADGGQQKAKPAAPAPETPPAAAAQ